MPFRVTTPPGCAVWSGPASATGGLLGRMGWRASCMGLPAISRRASYDTARVAGVPTACRWVALKAIAMVWFGVVWPDAGMSARVRLPDEPNMARCPYMMEVWFMGSLNCIVIWYDIASYVAEDTVAVWYLAPARTPVL